MAIWTFSAGLPTNDWQAALFDIIENGEFQELNAGLTEVTMTSGLNELVITSANDDIETTGLRTIIAGTGLTFVLKINGTTVFSINSFANDRTYVEVQSAIDNGPSDPSQLFALLAPEALDITGSVDPEVLVGGSQADTIDGGAGDDTITGGAGADTIDGGADTDTLDYSDEGGGGGIVVDLAAGTVTDTFGDTDAVSNVERVVGTELDDEIVGGDGSDSFVGGNGNDQLVGGDGNDTLDGGEGRDFLIGGDGDDSIEAFEDGGGPGPHYWGDYIMAGLGTNTINATAVIAPDGFIDGHDLSFIDIQTGVTANLALGTATATGMSTTFTNVHWLIGSGFADNFTGGSGSDVEGFSGNAGNDTIDGAGGWDLVDYWEETNVGYLDGNGDPVVGTLGVVVDLSNETATDSFGDTDTLVDIDEVRGTDFNDDITGNDDDNRFEGRDGNDLIRGLNGNNDYDGGDGDDTIEGGDGDDWMRGGEGNDVFRGGEGWNNIVYSDEEGPGRVIFDWNTGRATDTYGDEDSFDVWSIGSVHGNAQDDILIGNAEDNTFHGYDGVDLIVGGGGVDSIHFHGEQGYGGGAGVTIVLGEDDGNGNDVLADEADDPVFGTDYDLDELVNGSVKGWAIDGFGKTDTLYSIENAEGTEFNDHITGSNERNNLRGDDGNDTIVGRGGDDELIGGRGDDSLDGGDGSDYFEGDGGDDTVSGGIGRDVLGFYRWEDGNNDYDNDTVTIALTDDGVGTGSVTGTIFRDGENRSVTTQFVNIDVIEGTVGDDIVTVEAGFTTDGLGWDWRTFNDERDPEGPFQFIGGRGNDSVSDASGALVMAYASEYGMEDDHGTHGVVVNLSSATQTAVGFDEDGNAGDDTVASGTAIDTFGDTDTLAGVVLFDLTRGNDYFWGRETGGDTGVYVQSGDGNDYVIGGSSRDSLHGDNDNDTLMGGLGIDDINGGDGDDLMYGDDDSGLLTSDDGDQMGGGSGNDTMYGGAGRDNMGGDDGNDELFGGAGRDRLNGQSGNDVLRGQADADQIEGNDGDDYLFGGEGDDELRAGNDNDIAVGGKGNDDIEGQDGDDLLYGDGGFDEDTLAPTNHDDPTIIGNDTLRGGQGNDELYGGYGGDQLEGDDGNDHLEGGTGNDTLGGNGDNDTVLGGAGDDRVSGHEGNDSLDGGAGNDKLWGDDGNDILTGGDGTDDLNGGNDNDTLFASAGNDRLFGDSGNDTYEIGGFGFGELFDSDGTDLIKTSISRIMFNNSGLDTIENATITVATNGINLTGNDHHNVLTGGGGTNSLTGGDGNDTLLGAGGNDTLLGGAGADSLDGGTGNDSMLGGADSDTYVVDAAGDVADETGGTGTDLVKSSVTFSLANLAQAKGTIENLTLTGGNINGTGSAGSNVITGSAGINGLFGGGANDTLSGGAGADSLDGGTGNDSMLGGADSDTYVVDAAGDVADETGGTGTDLVKSSVTFSLANLAQAKGTIENLTLTGGNINGAGSGGNNILTGSAGNNSLSGEGGNDTISGGNGNDTIFGGAGNDSLTGGANNDFFVFNTAPNASTNVDRITDYSASQDTIRLENGIFTQVGGTGTLTAARFRANTSGNAQDADDRIIYETDTGEIYYDSNGSAAGGSVLIAILTTKPAVTNADFVII